MTKDEILTRMFENENKLSNAMDNIANAVEKINDQNVLDCQSIDRLGEAVKGNNKVISFIQWILIVMTLAIVVLAGAEKVLEFLPKL